MRTRWQALFADLEAHARALERSELEAEVADRTRGEVARIGLSARLRASVGGRLSFQVTGVGIVTGTLERIGSDWLLVSAPDETVIAQDAVVAVVDLPLSAVSPDLPAGLDSRVRTGLVLRAMARDRSVVTVRLRDGTSVTGTPDRVGSDFVDVAVHGRDEAPRPGQVRSRWTISLDALATVSRRV